jgi:hypothetical protein
MRVYTTDTKRIFLWDGFNWRCIHQPLMGFIPTGVDGFTLGTGGEIYGAYARYAHRVYYEGEIILGTGFSLLFPRLSLPVPARHVNGATGPRTTSGARFFDVNVQQIFVGTTDIHQSDPNSVRIYAGGPNNFPVTNVNPFAFAVGDQIWWSIEYEAVGNA